MKVAHLILAYHQPEQLLRLVKKLLCDDASVFIHIDKKADITVFDKVFAEASVYSIAKRETITWGSYSIVQATLNGFEAIANSGVEYDYINLLSGQDYPLSSAHSFHEFLAAQNGKLFMEFYDVNSIWKEAITRITEYHFTDYNIPGKHKIAGFINSVMPKRKMPENMIAVGRSQWFTITFEAMKYVLYYLERKSNVAKFFRLTWAPDEMFFQTILYNSPFQQLMVNDNLRFIDWSEGNASPKTFTLEDLDTLKNSSKFFARKFNADKDVKILNALDILSSIPFVV